jgi:hypothetical protein
LIPITCQFEDRQVKTPQSCGQLPLKKGEQDPWVDSSGDVHFRDDIYGKDKTLVKLD